MLLPSSPSSFTGLGVRTLILITFPLGTPSFSPNSGDKLARRPGIPDGPITTALALTFFSRFVISKRVCLGNISLLTNKPSAGKSVEEPMPPFPSQTAHIHENDIMNINENKTFLFIIPLLISC